MGAAITLVLVLTLVAVAVVEKHPGDYFLAGFALLYYGLTQITSLEWLATLFIFSALYTVYKGSLAYQGNRKK